jgi:hypothetical protein|tara:strand:+ start:660 stop:854 length:195 start_codon:yes stop_codon:yes gene_type:complete
MDNEMKIYSVRIEFTDSRVIDFQAKSKEEAEQLAELWWDDMGGAEVIGPQSPVDSNVKFIANEL